MRARPLSQPVICAHRSPAHVAAGASNARPGHAGASTSARSVGDSSGGSGACFYARRDGSRQARRCRRPCVGARASFPSLYNECGRLRGHSCPRAPTQTAYTAVAGARGLPAHAAPTVRHGNDREHFLAYAEESATTMRSLVIDFRARRRANAGRRPSNTFTSTPPAAELGASDDRSWRCTRRCRRGGQGPTRGLFRWSRCSTSPSCQIAEIAGARARPTTAPCGRDWEPHRSPSFGCCPRFWAAYRWRPGVSRCSAPFCDGK